MQPQSLDARVERLEKRVSALEELPARVDALTLQISQLREEMHVAFSATNTRIESLDQQLGRQSGQIESVREELTARMRMLHEDVIARLAPAMTPFYPSSARKTDLT